MKVKVSIVALVGFKPLNKVVDVELNEGATLDDLFTKLEKDGVVEKGFFKDILKARRPVTVLVDGERVSLPGDKKRVLKDGIEVSVVSPIAGGM